MKTISFKTVLTTILLGSVLFGLQAQAKMYKWKDENGQTHYGDRIPPQYLNKERKELNEQGTVIKKIKRAKTAEELAAIKKKEMLAKQKAAKLKEQQRRDRVLLDTYTTERDLILARDARIVAVESQIQLSNSIIESSREKLTKTEKQIEKIKASKRKVPEHISKKMEVEKKQLETQQAAAASNKKRLDDIKKQFSGYIARFKELKERKAAKGR